MFILIEFISQIMDENLFVNHIVLHVSVLGLFLAKKQMIIYIKKDMIIGMHLYAPSQESAVSCLCELGVSILPLFLHFFKRILELFGQCCIFLYFITTKQRYNLIIIVQNICNDSRRIQDKNDTNKYHWENVVMQENTHFANETEQLLKTNVNIKLNCKFNRIMRNVSS